MNPMIRLQLAVAVAALIVVGCSPKAAAPKVASISNPSTSSPEEWSADRPKANQPGGPTPSTSTNEMVPQATNTPAKPGNATNGTQPLNPKAVEAVKGAIDRNQGKAIPDIPKDGDWKGTVKDVQSVVATADKNLLNVKNAKMSFNMHAQLPEGNGEVNIDTIVGDSKRYLLRYARFEMTPQPHFETYIVTNRKGEEVTLVGQNYVPGRQSLDANMLRGWERNATHYLASAIGTQRQPLTELVSEAKKAGWKISGEQKAFANGTKYTRVLLTSKDAEPTRYEVVINDKEKLPVSFRAERRGSKKVSVYLNIGWAFNTKNLSDDDLSPKLAVDQVNILTPEKIAELKKKQKTIF